jgi:DNA helicase-2/ATP-dependent DNA helicase PcrA
MKGGSRKMSNEEEKIVYRKDQKPIMEYRGGTMAVPAVPGAGKTFIISNLVSQLIEERVHKPGKILIVTFMNSAVNNFKHRITKVLESKGITASNDYEVMTIHSLALKILKDRPDVMGVSEEFKVLDDIHKSLYLNRCIYQWRRNGGEETFRSLLSDYGNKKYYEKGSVWWEKDFFNTVDALIGELKLNDISPKKLKEEIRGVDENSILKYIADIYESYTKMLKKEAFIDYNDLLILAYKLLKTDHKLREKLEKKYTFVFEDECQDSNLIQGKILTLISKKRGNLVRVGDINQSINGTFSSSDPKFFKEFCENANRKFEMYMAGRSTKEIIDLANNLVDYTNKYHEEQECRGALVNQHIKIIPEAFIIKNPHVSNYGIGAFVLKSKEEEIKNAVELAVRFKNKYPDKTCAVLVPYNSQVIEIADGLRRLGKECDELSSKPNKRLKVTNTLGHILSFISEPHNNIKFKNLIQSIVINEHNEESEKLLNFIQNCEVEKLLYPIGGVLDENYISSEIINTKAYKELLLGIERIKRILEYPQTQFDRLILHISDTLDFSLEDRAMTDAVASYIRFTAKDNPEFCLKQIADQLLDENNTMLNHISSIIYELEGYEPTPERITVSTCHKSKGLEWDCVIILNITSYNYPYNITDKFKEAYYFKDEFKNPTALGKAEIAKILGNNICADPVKEAKIQVINEKIRLLYVGITRAKEYLMLLSPKCNEGKWNETKPSQYFYTLQSFISRKRGEAKC